MTPVTTLSPAQPWEFPGLELVVDTTRGGWIRPRLAEATFEVGMLVPAGFDAYARVFYPFALTNASQAPLTRWAQVAQRNGRRPHAEMERETITDPARGASSDLERVPADPEASKHQEVSTHPVLFTPDDVLSTLPPDQFSALADVLARHTSAAGRTWFCVWDGYGNLGLESNAARRIPRLHHPMRDYLVYTGPLAGWQAFAKAGHAEPPEYWWPDDRAWCFVTDTDFHWAYVAGSRACIEELVESSEIEALETRLSNRARFGMDTINRP
jgi:hypothetical protein